MYQTWITTYKQVSVVSKSTALVTDPTWNQTQMTWKVNEVWSMRKLCINSKNRPTYYSSNL